MRVVDRTLLVSLVVTRLSSLPRPSQRMSAPVATTGIPAPATPAVLAALIRAHAAFVARKRKEYLDWLILESIAVDNRRIEQLWLEQVAAEIVGRGDPPSGSDID